jgi:hypothetical protein
MIFGMFSLGAAAGLATIWWTQQPSGTSASRPKIENHAAAQKPGSPGRSGTSAGAPGGMNPQELPYDGIPPSLTEKVPPAAAVPSGDNEQPYRSVEGNERSEAKAGAGVELLPLAKQKPATPGASNTNGLPLPYEGASGSSGTAKTGTGTGTEDVAIPLPEKPRQAGAKEPERPDKTAPAVAQPKSENPQVAKSTQQRRSPQRAANDKEIQRIKQQAAEELKKKTDNKRLTARAKQDKLVGTSSRRLRLARCERASNFILREHCKWEVCNGMWGKNGCPSYDKQANIYSNNY